MRTIFLVYPKYFFLNLLRISKIKIRIIKVIQLDSTKY